MNTSYQDYFSSTIGRWNSKTYADAMTRNSAMLAWLRSNNRIKVVSALGTRALEPVMNYGVGNPLIQNVSNAYEPMSFAPVSGFTVAEYGWVEKILSISFERLQTDMQGAETQKVDWAMSIVDRERKRFFENITDELFRLEGASGANGAPASVALRASYITSIPCALNRGGSNTTHPATGYGLSEQTGTAVGSSPLTTFGNIERNAAGASWWCTPVFTGSTTSVTYENLAARLAVGTRGPQDYIDLGLTNRANFVKIKSIAQANQRHGDDGKLAQIGFDTVKLDKCEVIFDESSPASPSGGASVGQFFGLNSNYVRLQCNTMKPVIEDVSYPTVTLNTKGMRWVIALCWSNTGRVHVRDERIGSM